MADKESDVFSMIPSEISIARTLADASIKSTAEFMRMTCNPLSHVHPALIPACLFFNPWLALWPRPKE